MGKYPTLLLRVIIGGYLVYLGLGLVTGNAADSQYGVLFFCAGVLFMVFGAVTVVLGLKELIRDYIKGMKDEEKKED